MLTWLTKSYLHNEYVETEQQNIRVHVTLLVVTHLTRNPNFNIIRIILTLILFPFEKLTASLPLSVYPVELLDSSFHGFEAGIANFQLQMMKYNSICENGLY